MIRLCAILIALSVSSSVLAQEKQLSINSPDGKRTVTAKDKVINVTDNNTQKLVMSIKAHTTDITGLGYAPDGKLIGSVDKDGNVKFFEAATGKNTFSVKAGISGSLSFSPDGKSFSVKSEKVTKKYDLATGKEIK